MSVVRRTCHGRRKPADGRIDVSKVNHFWRVVIFYTLPSGQGADDLAT